MERYNHKEYQKQYQIDNAKSLKQYQIDKNNSPAIFKTYAHQLTVDESPRLAQDKKSLEVKCKYCGKYFKPLYPSVKSRIQALKGKRKGELNLYCSDGCKSACPTFRQHLYFKKKKNIKWIKKKRGGKIIKYRINNHLYTTEVVPLLRQLVLKRDNYTCQECNDTNVELHCHHKIPKSYDPMIQNDPDNCITYCKKCHIKKHKKLGCTYNELRKNSIKNC